MSHQIYIVDLNQMGLPAPKDLQQFWGIVEGTQSLRPGRQQKFVELARRLTLDFPPPGSPKADGDSVWLKSPMEEAEALTSAVWTFGLPRQQWPRVLVQLVHEATSLGLSVLDDQIAFGFVPGGKVIPEERSGEWEEFCVGAFAEERQSLAQIVRAVRQALTPVLIRNGFHSDEAEGVGRVGIYQRAVQEGKQEVGVFVREIRGEFRCTVRLRGFCPSIRAIEEAALGIRLDENRPEYDFTAASLERVPDHVVESAEEIRGLTELIERKTIPVLDRAGTVQGVDWLLNSGESGTGPYEREWEYTSLVAARLTGSGCIPELIALFTRRAANLAGMPEVKIGRAEQLEQLLRYLREEVPPSTSRGQTTS